jgi:hypothetical protein
VNVWDENGRATRGGGAADAPADRNTQAGGLALERAQNQLAAAAEVKPRPVEVGSP